MNEPLLPPDPLERAACLGLLGFAAATQVSIAATGILLTVTGLLWLADRFPAVGFVESAASWEPEYLRASGAERIAAGRTASAAASDRNPR